MSSLHSLARFVHARARAHADDTEECELCAASLDDEHAHIVDLDRHALCCACRACALLFARSGVGARRYRTVPSRVLIDPSFALSDEEWRQLEVPVRLAFVFFSSPLGRWVACYPSPAGTAEAELCFEAWNKLATERPLVRAVEPDVEALLLYGKRGASGAPLEAFLVPIDACYALVARVRRHWSGIEGGDEVRREVEEFFSGLRARCRPLSAAHERGGQP